MLTNCGSGVRDVGSRGAKLKLILRYIRFLSPSLAIYLGSCRGRRRNEGPYTQPIQHLMEVRRSDRRTALEEELVFGLRR
jgi:hypothetical protein